MSVSLSKTEHHILSKVSAAAENCGVSAFVIGGFVRDKFLHRPCKDIDIVCTGSGIELAAATSALLGNDIKVNYFKNFGTAQFVYKGIDIEFVGARKESYQRDSRKPIVEIGTLEDDQLRRDFTINALALSLSEDNFLTLIDPFDGMNDLSQGIIRTPQSPSTTFDDDPLRMLRAIRFATQLNFKIEQQTYKAIAPLAQRLQIISQERITSELQKIIASPLPSTGFKHLFNTQLLHQFFPEMVALQGVEVVDKYAHKDNFYHTLKVLDNVAQKSENIWLRWAAVMHDIAKPLTQRFEEGHGWTFHGHEALGAKITPRIFGRLKLPTDERMRYVQKLVALHLRPISLTKDNITDSAIRRLIFDAADELDDLLLLCEADITSKNEEKVKKYLSNLKMVRSKIIEVEERDHIKNWQPPITGELIMDTFQLKPSREVGMIKNAIKDAILDGIIPNNYEEAYQYMLQEAHKLGLTIS